MPPQGNKHLPFKLSKRVLTREEEQALTREYCRTKDKRLANKLVVANLRFVIQVAQGYKGYNLALEDLVQEGALGLMRAVEKFDPEFGVRLITYASWWIKAYISRYVLKTWSIVALGTKNAHRVLFFQVRAMEEKFRHSLPVGADIDAALVEHFGFPVHEIREMRGRFAVPEVSFDEPVNLGGRVISRVENTASPSKTPEAQVLYTMPRVKLREVVATLQNLTPRERYVIEKRWLNYLGEQPSLGSLGEHLKVSRERVRQIQVAAIRKIRVGLEQVGITEAV